MHTTEVLELAAEIARDYQHLTPQQALDAAEAQIGTLLRTFAGAWDFCAEWDRTAVAQRVLVEGQQL